MPAIKKLYLFIVLIGLLTLYHFKTAVVWPQITDHYLSSNFISSNEECNWAIKQIYEQHRLLKKTQLHNYQCIKKNSQIYYYSNNKLISNVGIFLWHNGSQTLRKALFYPLFKISLYFSLNIHKVYSLSLLILLLFYFIHRFRFKYFHPFNLIEALLIMLLFYKMNGRLIPPLVGSLYYLRESSTNKTRALFMISTVMSSATFVAGYIISAVDNSNTKRAFLNFKFILTIILLPYISSAILKNFMYFYSKSDSFLSVFNHGLGVKVLLLSTLLIFIVFFVKKTIKINTLNKLNVSFILSLLFLSIGYASLSILIPCLLIYLEKLIYSIYEVYKKSQVQSTKNKVYN